MPLPRPPWQNPRWNSVRDPDLRAILFDLQEFLKRPSFPNGMELGDGTVTGGDPDIGLPPGSVTEAVDSSTLQALEDGLPPDDGASPAAPPKPTVSNPAPFMVSVNWTANTEVDMVNGYGQYVVETYLVEFASTVASTRTGMNAFTGAVPADLTFKFRAKAVDAWGNESSWSPYSDEISVSRVGTSQIEPLAIDETLVADDAISTPKLQANSVDTNILQAGAVTADILAGEIVLAEQEIRTGNNPDPRVVISDGNTGAGIALHPGASSSVYPAELFASDLGDGVYAAHWVAPQPNPLPAESPGAMEFTVDVDAESSDLTIRADRIYLQGATPGVVLDQAPAAIGNDTWTTVGWSSGDVLDTDPWFMLDAANDWLEIPYDGLWLVSLHVQWPAGPDGLRAMATLRNGSYRREFDAMYYTSAGLVRYTRATAMEMQLNAGDTLAMQLRQVSGGSLTPTNVRFSARMVSAKNVVWV